MNARPQPDQPAEAPPHFGDPPARAQAVLESTADWFPYSIDPSSVAGNELALAGVARCRRLLQGLIELHGAPDLAGLAARALYETWLTTAYLILGGGEAIDRVEASDLKQQQRIAKRFIRMAEEFGRPDDDFLSHCDAVVSREINGSPLNTWELAELVGAALEAEGDPNADYPVKMYAALFGPESYTSVHGGLGAIKQYMLRDGQVQSAISDAPWEHRAHDHRLDLMTTAVLALSYRVGGSLGLSTERLVACGQAWSAAGFTQQG